MDLKTINKAKAVQKYLDMSKRTNSHLEVPVKRRLNPERSIKVVCILFSIALIILAAAFIIVFSIT